MDQAPKIDVPRLKRAIIEHTGEGREMTRRGLSMLASGGKNPDLVRDLMSRGQDRKVSFETASGIAKALGFDVGEFLVGVEPASSGPLFIKVLGAVEAGVFRQQERWEEDRQFEVEVTPTPYSGTNRFGLLVVGRSMDKVFLPGTVLDCFDVYGPDGLRPEPGDVVIVQRKQGDLIETTCKRLERLADGSYQLRAESHLPEFGEPIPIGRPDNEHFGDDDTTIIGIVNVGLTPSLKRSA